MALNYAEQWSPELLEILMQGTLTSPFVTSNVRWLDAKTFHFTQMSTSGYKNHNRKGGWNVGSYEQKDVPYTLTHDRDVEFMVDKADVDETNATASIQRHLHTQRQKYSVCSKISLQKGNSEDTKQMVLCLCMFAVRLWTLWSSLQNSPERLK